MSWIVKNVTGGIVCVNDVRLMFAPGEEIDVDTSVHVQRNGGSDHLLRLISKGTLQTISRGDSSQSEEILMSEPEKSEPMIQSVDELDPEKIKEIVLETMSQVQHSSMDVGDLKTAFKEAFSEALSELKGQMTPQNVVLQGSSPSQQAFVQMPQEKSQINLDEINAKIHSRRIDEVGLSGEIISKSEEAQSSVEDKIASLRSLRGKNDNS